MKKLLCKMLCTAMAVSVVSTAVPMDTSAAVKGRDTAVQQLQSLRTKSSGSLQKDSYVEGEVLVVSAKSAGSTGKTMINALESRTKKLGAVIEGSYSIDAGNGKNQFQISLIKSDKYSTKELMEKYQNSTGVKLVQPNFKYHASNVDAVKYDNMLWAIGNKGQNAGTESFDINSDSEKIKMAAGEEAKEKVVAIIDTGVDYSNPELSSYIWNNPYTSHLKGEHGYDFVNQDADPMDDAGHGTHCAGIITSVLNGENVKIMPLKFLDSDGYGDTYGAIGAYNYIYTAQRLGVNVISINNSWGGGADNYDEILKTFINLVGENGAVSVCAAGNEEANLDEYYTSPASLDSPYIISVAAANEKGELAQFSNYSAKDVDIAAPGADILSYVSYNCFNPVVYKDAEDGKELCGTYEDFNGQLLTPDVPQKLSYSNPEIDSVCYNLEQSENSEGHQEVVLTKNDFFGEKTEEAQAMQWNITGAKAGENYVLYLPYEQEASSTPVYLHMMLKTQAPDLTADLGSLFIECTTLWVEDLLISEDGSYTEDDLETIGSLGVYGKENYWNQISVEKNSNVKKAGKRAIALNLLVEESGDYSFTIDDFAISKSNVEEEEFGKTAFYNGTSMAAPYVSGAVAALSNAYPKDTVKERIARVEGAVQKTEGLKGKVAADGMLDLDKVDNPEPSFEKIAIQKSGELEIQGSFFHQSCQVTVNGQNAKIKSQTEKSIVVEGNYYNKNLQVDVVMGDSTYSEKCYFSKGSSPKKLARFPMSNYDSTMVCAGDTMYWVNSMGEVYGFTQDNVEYQEIVEVLYYGGDIYSNQIFENATNSPVLEGDPVCLDSDLYMIATIDTGYSKEAALITFNMYAMQWEKVADLPDDYTDLNKLTGLYAYTKPTLAAYNGKLYLIGGFDESKGEAVNSVYVYDVKSKKWSKGVSMPEGRFAAKALQTGNNLVVTLGGNGTEQCPKNLIFDGKNWRSSEVQLNLFETESYYYGTEDGQEVSYATGDVGISAGAIVYTDCQADGIGDIFCYDVKEDKYVSMGYSLGELERSRGICASVLGDRLYIIGSPKESGESTDETFIYSVDVKDGRYIVEETALQDGGSVWGTGIYMPGSSVTLTAEPWEDYYLKSFSVNGKTLSVKKEGISTTIPNITSNMEVCAEFGAYVTELMLENEKISLTAGRKTKLNVEVYPENAESKALSFKSSNTKVVTVDSKGNVKANKNAAGKSAVITVTAKDRKTVIAKCTVKVKKPVYVKKIALSTKKNTKKVKAGKTLTINAAVSPAKADITDLTWSSSNKKYATVSNGKVTAKKAGIGKTVTITAKATDGSKVKASIKIKIVK